jgi:hypothetical protein
MGFVAWDFIKVFCPLKLVPWSIVHYGGKLVHKFFSGNEGPIVVSFIIELSPDSETHENIVNDDTNLTYEYQHIVRPFMSLIPENVKTTLQCTKWPFNRFRVAFSCFVMYFSASLIGALIGLKNIAYDG